jgi:hypothetical protein
MMDFLFGADMPLAVRFLIAFVIVLALIGATAFLVRRFGSERLGGAAARGRQPRLAVIDAAPVDGRRRLILIRRDNVEHLLMIGGPTDLLVEANIARTAIATRDATAARPPAAASDPLPRPVPLGEGNMWPLQPTTEPATPRPARPAAEEPMAWHPAEPELPPPPRRPEPRTDVRPEPRTDARPEPRTDIRPEPRVADPLAGLAAELSRVQPEAPKPRPGREREFARMPRPERVRPAQASGDEPVAPTADQNLADMAHQLEAALRRPKAAEPRAPETAPRPAAMNRPAMPEPMSAAAEPAVATADTIPEHVEDVPVPPNPGAARPAAQKPAASKSVYDSLEQEMASLLGRPNNKT